MSSTKECCRNFTQIIINITGFHVFSLNTKYKMTRRQEVCKPYKKTGEGNKNYRKDKNSSPNLVRMKQIHCVVYIYNSIDPGRYSDNNHKTII